MSEKIRQMKYVFSTRQKFIIVGLTGRTGSGCTEAAELLSKSISVRYRVPGVDKCITFGGKVHESVS